MLFRSPQLEPATHEQESAEPETNTVWRFEHDILKRETKAITGYGGDYPAAEDAPSFAERYEGTVAVSTRDPGIAWAKGSCRYEMRFPEATVVSEVGTSLVSDRDSYRLEIDLRTSEDGQERWTRRWERTFPRDHQ